MKNIIYLLSVALILFTSCTGVKTVSTGLEDEAKLQFVGKPSQYKGGVDVNIDEGKYTFKGEVVKPHAKRPKGKLYAIPTGTHKIKVSYKGEIIYDEKIFISAQETRKIKLK